MQFDIRTLLVAATLTTAFCAGARFLLWRMHPRMPGLAHWAAAGVSGVLGLALIAFHGPRSTVPMLSLAQLLMVAGFLLSWDGFRRFVDRPPLSRRVVAMFIVITLGTIVLARMEQTLTIRSLTNALLISLLSALIANELLSSARTGQLTMRATGWAFAANAALFLVRAAAADQGSDTFSNWNPDGFAALPLLWWQCMIIATTLGMVLMTGERLQANLDRQASSDPLTGALNRRAFSILAAKELARAQRHGLPLSLLMMDLDHFKQINDRLGHGSGDAILCRFVAVATRVLRGEDVLCRFGGEEFVALLPGTADAQALVAAERLRLAFAREGGGGIAGTPPLPFAITVSIGVSELKQGEDIDSALHRADSALYRAKAMGRNQCAAASDPAEETVRQKRVSQGEV